MDLLTKDIMGFKTYEDYKDDWIYEWNEDIPWVDEKPWTDAGVWTEPKPVKHTCKPFNYKTGYAEWPTCSWREDGYCNGGNLPDAYHIGNSPHYQDLEWYEDLEDSELKDEASRNKAIMEGLISDNESGNDCWKRWKSHEIYYHNYDEGECENKTHEEGHELCRNISDDGRRMDGYAHRGEAEEKSKLKTSLTLEAKNIDEYWWRIDKSGDLEVLES
ncbi:hypothetical protein Tco_0839919 [Tanacetum coccineum]|uniref:Uncharacterized protein n=1 Tax=Tanacetum coccineum TaxID=301880 RepID=A0ABQ5AV40_9ASTR